MFDGSHSLPEFCEQNLLYEMTPLLPLGEKVADRPDEGLSRVTSLPDGALTPALSPKFFARMLPCEAKQHPQKPRG
jgi:hypothetical protein